MNAVVAQHSPVALGAERPELVDDFRSGHGVSFLVGHRAGGQQPAEHFIVVAFGNDRPLAEVAKQVVSRALRFDAGSGEKDPAP